jgi:phage gpG-like protein
VKTVEFTDPQSAEHAAQQLAAYARKVGDPLPVLERAREILANDEELVFQSQGGAIGSRWSALAADTVARKTDDRILVMTGKLLDALTTPSNVHVTAESATLAPRGVPYASYHMSGTKRMPARPFMGISAEAQNEFLRTLSQYLAVLPPA